MAHHHHHHDQVYNTNHYVWSSRDRLGYGATGAVYLGYNKVALSACLSHYRIAGKSDRELNLVVWRLGLRASMVILANGEIYLQTLTCGAFNPYCM